MVSIGSVEKTFLFNDVSLSGFEQWNVLHTWHDYLILEMSYLCWKVANNFLNIFFFISRTEFAFMCIICIEQNGFCKLVNIIFVSRYLEIETNYLYFVR